METFLEGWYCFARSTKIKAGQIYTFDCFNTSFICFRDSHNLIHIFNAFCPHLGAHLGVGGKIKNDQLICPFHGWKYNSSGECTEIPYCKIIPKKAKLQSYKVKEILPFIYFKFTTTTDAQPTIEKTNEEDHELQKLSQLPFKDTLEKYIKLNKFQKFIAKLKSSYNCKD